MPQTRHLYATGPLAEWNYACNDKNHVDSQQPSADVLAMLCTGRQCHMRAMRHATYQQARI